MVWGYQCYYHGGLPVPTARGSWSIYVVVVHKSKQSLKPPRKERVDLPQYH